MKAESNIQNQGIGELKRELKFVEKEFPNPEKFQESLQKIEANGNVEKLKQFLKEGLGLPILADNICLLRRFIKHRIDEMRKQPITT